MVLKKLLKINYYLLQVFNHIVNLSIWVQNDERTTFTYSNFENMLRNEAWVAVQLVGPIRSG